MYNKLKKIISNPRTVLLVIVQRYAIIFPNKLYVKLTYWLIMRNRLNLNNPETFNEKLNWLKLYDRDSRYTQMVDKVDVKKYVANIIGNEYIIPTLNVFDNIEDIRFEELPEKFIMKCNHDSGGYIICKDKYAFDINLAKRVLKKRLNRNYYNISREWPYKNVVPRILCEQLLEDGSGELNDYKFMVFHGKVEFVFVCTERSSSSGIKVDFFDTNWNHLPFQRKYPNSITEISKPENFNEMIKLAERLAHNIKSPFIRVDFYEINKKIYFGELTFYPGGGLESFTPEEWDRILGNYLMITNV